MTGRGAVEIEAVLVALDVGTSKVVALVGEVTREGAISIIGKGVVPASGLKKGVVNNIEQTVASIRQAVEGAERLSGLRLEAAFVGVGGSQIESLNSRGAVAVSGPHREVSREDVDRATEVARAITIPSNREVLHVLPRDFSVDGQEGVKDPIGMSAVRLEVETHIVHGSATALQNLTKCVRQAGVRVDELVIASLASGEAVLSETERELGVAVADMGAGTTDLALYLEGSPFHTSVLPLGGINVTNDVAIGLKTNLVAAEQLKLRFGTADPSSVIPDAQWLAASLILPAFFLIGVALHAVFVHFKVREFASMLVTFGLTILIQSFIQWIWSADYLRYETSYAQDSLRVGPLYIPLLELVGFGFAATLAVGAWLALNRTMLGKALRASAQDGPVAAAFGINADGLSYLLAGLCAASAGVAGVFIALTSTLAPSQIEAWIGVVFAVVIIGGLANPLGALAAGMLVGVSEAVTMALVNPAWAPLVAFSILIILLLWKPRWL